jgi:aryl-alcohol dehydrogenase-like predicted oxidoreductase
MQADSSTVVAALPAGTPPEQVQENLKAFSLMNLAQASRDRSYATWLKESVTLAKIDPD